MSPTKGWTSAVNLRAGDVLYTLNGEYVIVEQVQHEILEKPVWVYNFEVASDHTYFVGENGVGVHNNCYSKRILHDTKIKGYNVSLDIELGGSGQTNIHLKIDQTKYFWNPEKQTFISNAGIEIPNSLRGNSKIEAALQKALSFNFN
jgi:hypothetical protein